jgi:hypothetical protein
VDEEAYCCLAVGDDFQVHLKFNEHFDGVIFYTELGEVPTIGQKEILRHYVMENGSANSESLSFTYDSENKNIGMLRLLPKKFLDLEHFKNILEKFIERLQKEHEAMGRFIQGELPKDNIQFTEDADGNATTSFMEGGEMQFARL